MPYTSLPCSQPACKINASKLSDAANTVVVTLRPFPCVCVTAPARASKNRNSDVSTNFGCGCPEHLGGCPTQHCGCPGTLKSIQIDTYELSPSNVTWWSACLEWHYDVFLVFVTFCRLKPVKTGKWQKLVFAGKNANPALTAARHRNVNMPVMWIFLTWPVASLVTSGSTNETRLC